MSPQLRLVRALYHEWRLLPERERGRLAPIAREVKELALDLRGSSNPYEIESQLAMANEGLAIVIMDSVQRDPDMPRAEIEELRAYLQQELRRAAPVRRAA